LDGSEWLLSEFSGADCQIGYSVWIAAQVTPMDDHPALSAYLARCMARPAFQAACGGIDVRLRCVARLWQCFVVPTRPSRLRRTAAFHLIDAQSEQASAAGAQLQRKFNLRLLRDSTFLTKSSHAANGKCLRIKVWGIPTKILKVNWSGEYRPSESNFEPF
jgi:hypothetical protein